MRVLCTGGGGMIGGALVKRLLDEGHEVRTADVKPINEWWQVFPEIDNRSHCDVGDLRMAERACEGIDWVFHLACPMGGIGHITANQADCATSARNTTNMLEASVNEGVDRFFLSSSACVYRADRQEAPESTALREADAWPADPEPGYGLSKLFEEELCRYFQRDYGLKTRVARYHNVYGLPGSWTGGREKAPAALARKVAEAVVSGDHRIEIWGDGKQTRSFMWLDDCIEGTIRLMESDFADPINVGSSELVTINQMVSALEEIAGVQLERSYDTSAPMGVRGRNSDNTLIKQVLGWEPSTPLLEGLGQLYPWIAEQVTRA